MLPGVCIHEPDAALERIAELAALMVGVRSAFIRLLDDSGEWSDRCYGPCGSASERLCSLSTGLSLRDDLIIIPDTLEDPSWPAARGEHGVRFFAAAPLRSSAGTPAGVLCLAGDEPRPLCEEDASALRSFAALAVYAIEMRALVLGGEDGHWEVTPPERRRILEASARNLQLQDTLAQLILLIERQCPSMHAVIFLERDGRFHLVATPGLPEGWREPLEDPRAQACCIAAPTCDEILARLQIEAYRTTPVRSSSGQRLGVLLALYRKAESRSPGDEALLEMAALLAAIAIEQRDLTSQLAHIARHDPLTGLPNRAFFSELLNNALDEAGRSGQSAAVLFLDLDRFKHINDSMGHAAGDALLEQVGRRLRSCLREGDSLARMGGDEFTLLLANLPDPSLAVTVAKRVLEVLHAPFEIDGRQFYLTGSIGAAVYPDDASDAAALLRDADRAMYCIKNGGRNGVQRFSPLLKAQADERVALEDELRNALERGQLCILFQPQFDRCGRIDTMEVLLAWNHPTLGQIRAERFIPIAEECGWIVPIGKWVLFEACRTNAEWQRAGLPPVTLAVNISSLEFDRPGFVSVVREALTTSRLPAGSLELEITETLLMKNLAESVHRMARLRRLGVGLAIDDFGTGYSSLSYLRRLPVNTLKIDRSFLDELESTRGALPLIRTIIDFAHDMGLSVVIEGVETEAQLELLRTAGYDKAQGHLFGGPLDANAAAALLARQATR